MVCKAAHTHTHTLLLIVIEYKLFENTSTNFVSDIQTVAIV